MNWFDKISLYFHTVRYLKVRQIVARLWRKIYKPSVDLSPAPRLRAQEQAFCMPIVRPSAAVSAHTYCFLNQCHDIASSHIWNDRTIDTLWLYNLHYFDTFDVDLAWRWVDENAPGKGVGWEPYPISVRIVNWIKYHFLKKPLPEKLLHSLAVQTRYLYKRIEWHLMGNHLIANAKALVFAGLFFSGQEAQKWLEKGLAILHREIPEQILQDGAHFERSPMYHAIILEDFLDIINIFTSYGELAPKNVLNVISPMLCWLATMTHPDGDIAFFNDAACGVAPKLDQLLAYSARLGVRHQRCQTRMQGYYRLANKGAVLLADAAPIGPDYLPGHAHADTLSFELSLQGQRVFVNSGISCYGQSEERARQRGTAAHNTVMIDRQDSSEVWSGFRVARRARVLDVDLKNGTLSAAHDGYHRLKDSVTHRRTWKLSDIDLEIIDEIQGKKTHHVQMFFHLHPEISVDDNMFLFSSGQVLARCVFEGGLQAYIRDDCYHPEFGLSVPAKTIVLEGEIKLPLRTCAKIVWGGI